LNGFVFTLNYAFSLILYMIFLILWYTRNVNIMFTHIKRFKTMVYKSIQINIYKNQ